MENLFKDYVTVVRAIEIVPSFIFSIVIAETFYKLGSFTLECSLFLATWALSGWLIRKFNGRS